MPSTFSILLFRFFNTVVFLLKLSIPKFLTLFILLIHSFYTNNINFLNILRKSGLAPPFIHTTLMQCFLVLVKFYRKKNKIKTLKLA